jgi:membrane protein implicated in regulation of membrane protease activity
MIIIGIILLILGFLTGIGILWTLGIIALLVGLILLLVGYTGHPVGGRRWYW